MADRYIPETNYLMTLVEKEFHKAVKATSDFDNLAFEIEDKTGEHISVSTLKFQVFPRWTEELHGRAFEVPHR